MQAPYGLFAAAADGAPESQAALAALCPNEGAIALVETLEAPAPPGLRVIDRGDCVQMLADAVAAGETDIAFTPWATPTPAR